jgi:hypothetical protein
MVSLVLGVVVGLQTSNVIPSRITESSECLTHTDQPRFAIASNIAGSARDQGPSSVTDVVQILTYGVSA